MLKNVKYQNHWLNIVNYHDNILCWWRYWHDILLQCVRLHLILRCDQLICQVKSPMAPFTCVSEMPVLLASLLMLLLSASTTNATFSATPGNFLSSFYYDLLCPGYGTAKLQQVTATIVKQYVNNDNTIAPSLLRLAFHDSFVRVSRETGIHHVNLV